MIARPLLLGTFLLTLAGCAPRFATTHFERWAKEDLARRSETPAAPAAAAAAASSSHTGAPVPSADPSAPSPAAPPAENSSGYPDAAPSGTNSPDASSEGRVVRPTEEDEVLY